MYLTQGAERLLMDTQLPDSLKKKKPALLEKLTVAWVVKKLPAFYGIRSSSRRYKKPTISHSNPVHILQAVSILARLQATRPLNLKSIPNRSKALSVLQFPDWYWNSSSNLSAGEEVNKT
jgi:hypothetical protein